MIILIGQRLIESVKLMDDTFSGMISNTFFNCILVATLTLYLASSVIFRDFVFDLFLSSLAGLLIFSLCMSRLGRLTLSGHRLTKTMQKSVYLLDRYRFTDSEVDIEEVDLLRRDLRYHAESPINPFSAFSLTSNNLLGACGTIITYIIVLLQFKIAEPGTI